MKRIKLQTLIKRENKRRELKTVAEVLKYKHNFEVKRMKDLFKNTDIKEIAKYLCKFERRLLKNTGLNCAYILNKENMERIG